MHRRLLLIAGLTALAGPALGADAINVVTDPVEFVRNVYAELAADPAARPPEDVFTPRTAALLAGHFQYRGDGRITRSFWLNGAEARISGLRVTGRDVAGQPGWKRVTARFKNAGLTEEIDFTFQSGLLGWKLDDIASGESSLVAVLAGRQTPGD